MAQGRFARMPTLVLAALAAAVAVTGCDSGDTSGLSQTGPTSIPRGTRQFSTDFLLYTGNGTWGAEVSAIQGILSAHGASVKAVVESDLNSMSQDDLAQYGALIMPGGSGGTEMAGLTKQTKINIRKAVQDKGLNYVGFCAGSFVAVAPAVADDQVPAYGLGVLAGPDLPDYFRQAYFDQTGQLDVEMDEHTFADGSKRQILWYGGPVVPETAAGVIARYPDGEAAMSQAWSGNGFVVLSATHPTVDEATKTGLGLTDSDGSDQDIAWKLLNAAKSQQELPRF